MVEYKISSYLDFNISKFSYKKNDFKYGQFGHYTSVSSAIKILNSSNFWASDIRFTNDPSDGRILINNLMAIIVSNLEFMNYFRSDSYFMALAVGKELPYLGVEKEILSAFEVKYIREFMYGLLECLHRRNAMKGDVSSDRACNYFVISFVDFASSEDLMLWRAYGGGGSGICLRFDKENIISNFQKSVLGKRISVVRCQYIDDYCIGEYSKKILKCLFRDIKTYYNNKYGRKKIEFLDFDDEDVLFLNNISEKLEFFSLSFKAEAYRGEKEVRILVSIPSCGEKMNYNSSINYNVSGNLLVPYVNLGFDMSSINEIVCGPGTDLRLPVSLQQFVDQLCLVNKHQKRINVLRSNVEYTAKS